MLRCANVLGRDLVTLFSRALSLPVTPTIAGFDPQLQFVEQEDVVRAIEFAVTRELEGVYNVAGDGRIPWSEVAHICEARVVPMLPPVLTGLVADAMAAIKREDFHAAVLDVNLDGEVVYPVADAVLARGVPFVFVTGYSADGIDRRFAQVPVLQKPIERQMLQSVFCNDAQQSGEATQR